jgi:hypothetical protein
VEQIQCGRIMPFKKGDKRPAGAGRKKCVPNLTSAAVKQQNLDAMPHVTQWWLRVVNDESAADRPWRDLFGSRLPVLVPGLGWRLDAFPPRGYRGRARSFNRQRDGSGLSAGRRTREAARVDGGVGGGLWLRCAGQASRLLSLSGIKRCLTSRKIRSRASIGDKSLGNDRKNAERQNCKGDSYDHRGSARQGCLPLPICLADQESHAAQSPLSCSMAQLRPGNAAQMPIRAQARRWRAAKEKRRHGR